MITCWARLNILCSKRDRAIYDLTPGCLSHLRIVSIATPNSLTQYFSGLYSVAYRNAKCRILSGMNGSSLRLGRSETSMNWLIPISTGASTPAPGLSSAISIIRVPEIICPTSASRRSSRSDFAIGSHPDCVQDDLDRPRLEVDDLPL